VMDDNLMGYVPNELEPTGEEIEGVLRDAW
jgi:hypothetical protein